jgi:hypothetical protein
MGSKYRLTKIKLDEVSLVGSGDDARANVILSKSDSTQDGSDSIPANQLGGNGMGGKKATPAIIDKSALPDDVREYIDALEEVVLAKDDEQPPNDADDELGDEEDYDDEDEVEDDDGDEEDEADEQPKTKAKVGKVGKSDDGDQEGRQPVSKRDVRRVLAKADPEVRALITKMQTDIDEANAIAKHERDERERREWIAKAATLGHINDNPDHLGGLMKALHDKAPDEAEAVEKLLRSANSQVAKSSMWDEIGRSGGDFSGSALEMKAAEIMKSDPKLSKEQAETRALEADPSLYDEYLSERGAR